MIFLGFMNAAQRNADSSFRSDISARSHTATLVPVLVPDDSSFSSTLVAANAMGVEVRTGHCQLFGPSASKLVCI